MNNYYCIIISALTHTLIYLDDTAGRCQWWWSSECSGLQPSRSCHQRASSQVSEWACDMVLISSMMHRDGIFSHNIYTIQCVLSTWWCHLLRSPYNLCRIWTIICFHFDFNNNGVITGTVIVIIIIIIIIPTTTIIVISIVVCSSIS